MNDSIVCRHAEAIAAMKVEIAAYEAAILPFIKRLNDIEEKLLHPVYDDAVVAADAELLEVIETLPSGFYRSELRMEYKKRLHK